MCSLVAREKRRGKPSKKIVIGKEGVIREITTSKQVFYGWGSEKRRRSDDFFIKKC